MVTKLRWHGADHLTQLSRWIKDDLLKFRHHGTRSKRTQGTTLGGRRTGRVLTSRIGKGHARTQGVNNLLAVLSVLEENVTGRGLHAWRGTGKLTTVREDAAVVMMMLLNTYLLIGKGPLEAVEESVESGR